MLDVTPLRQDTFCLLVFTSKYRLFSDKRDQISSIPDLSSSSRCSVNGNPSMVSRHAYIWRRLNLASFLLITIQVPWQYLYLEMVSCTILLIVHM